MHKIKGANQGIGYRTAVTSINWVDHSIEFVSGDIFVMLTDGFTTQIGGPRGTAFGNRRLQEFLAECKTEKPETLMSELRILLTEWQGLHQRRDDITVLIFSPSETAKLN
jgi:serine phosphatase RsbU (regulator of sigma subunit)